MFKKNWFQANGHEQEKAFLILLLSETLKHSRCSQEDNEFSSDDHLKFFIVASSYRIIEDIVLSRLTNEFLAGFDRYYQLWSLNPRSTNLKWFSAFILKRGLDLNLENLSELSCSHPKCLNSHTKLSHL